MSGLGVFRFGERPTLLMGRGGEVQKHPSQGGNTVGEEEAKTSKPGMESNSKGSKLMGKQVGVGWFKMIQARGYFNLFL